MDALRIWPVTKRYVRTQKEKDMKHVKRITVAKATIGEELEQIWNEIVGFFKKEN